ncbi:AMMECR1 domain-containing protein [bacterium CPR1]|nr:AMMECR1 domain-containing protein [bacterium CPR1]
MSDRETLRQLLTQHAFLSASPGNPLAYRGGGGSPPWILYTWDVSLDGRATPVLGRCLWERLKDFRARQVASYGYTGLPLVVACLSQATEPLGALSIRTERKTHGSLRKIDGPGDREIPVVVIDDSLVSGSSMLEAIRSLEEEGFTVEGCLALVGFKHRGGVDLLRGLGYRVEILYDVHQDLGREHPELIPPYRNVVFGPEILPEGLHPAVAVRETARILLGTGQLPQPPRAFDRVYDGRGGVFVSLRQISTDQKLARLGYWLFDSAESVPGRDLVVATAMTLAGLELDLSAVKICVTFFGPLEPTLPADLDYWNRGLVVRSTDLPYRVGGALPNTEVFTDELEQYRHARFKNAGLGVEEPHVLLTHTLTKCVEPGHTWPSFGSPKSEEPSWLSDRQLADRITQRALQHLESLATGSEPEGEPLPEDLLGQPLFGLSVSLYRNGLAGCGVSYEGSLDECLRRAARTALLEDERYLERRRGVPVRGFAVLVSLLYEKLWLGEGGTECASRLRRGLDSLALATPDRQALFLNHVSVHRSWDFRATAEQLLFKAGLPPKATAHWTLLPTISWLRRGDKLWGLDFGFPRRSTGARTLLDNPAPLARFLAKNNDGLPILRVEVCTGHSQPQGAPAKRLHALWALTRAARLLNDEKLARAAEIGQQTCLELLTPAGLAGGSRLADALLMLVLLESPEEHEAEAVLAELLGRLIQNDGRIVEGPRARGVELELDCLSGAVLLGLITRAHRRNLPLPDLESSLTFYRRRFRLCHPWAMVGWHAQAWSLVPEAADLVQEMADWAEALQHRASGAFLCDLDPDGFSFHTGFIAEGMARAGRWKSCENAFRFLERLRLRPEDAPLLASPDFVGGVRGSLNRAEVRCDYVSHALTAALNYLDSRAEPEEGSRKI